MELRFGRYTVSVGNPDKVLFPGDGLTKLDLVEHYRRVAPAMVQHAGGRPVTIQRFPDGIGAGGFFQKHASNHFPDWIERVTVPKAGGTVEHVVIQRAADLVYLADQGAIAVHVALAPAAHVDRPDRMVFDLDPSGDDEFEAVRDGARLLRELLDDLGLVPYLMTTGSRGLHVVTPIAGTEPFDEIAPLAEAVARAVAEREPDRYTVEARKAQRRGRVYIDWMRNQYSQTAVAPWSLRPKPGAPVAVPLDWGELEDPELTSRRYRIGDVPALLERPDPWSGMARRARSTDRARRRLGRPPR
ncbi:MAG TPA: non-homologous end-joining DNA ligase [Acidimicrobiales bacterium]